MADLRIDIVNGAVEIPERTNSMQAVTGGLGNPVLLSLFIPPWWGNRIVDRAARYVSKLSPALQDTLTIAGAQNTIASARQALTWMEADGIASAVEITGEIASRERLDLRVAITEPNRRRSTYVYGLNWSATQAEVSPGTVPTSSNRSGA